MILQLNFWVFVRRKKNHYLERYLHPLFTAALFTVAKTWEQPKCP